ncbi:PilZ domain-containing protein [Simiduia sp. 21SJ11W-1]|uniref:PilZ domain-containing protein n=1 Tax=Simiduia sp. 21SJ11W-1 TaxID=2909669 RepID=UPI00209E9AF6|nr:PilZ domain-containing protein [Simiduia sp. 21SJ11W-1]UTA46681.1 PilZ domain-containing protein [Simiduia sp. 21SJ11W-1]
MDADRRRYARQATSIRVEMTHPAFGTLVGYTRDISDGGASVQLETELVPPPGTQVLVVFRKIAGQVNDEPVAMKIMHQNKSTVGLMFCPR